MPCASKVTLPASVRHHFPPRAQNLHREAFNDAWSAYAANARREEIALGTAWAAVERRFHKGRDGERRFNAH